MTDVLMRGAHEAKSHKRGEGASASRRRCFGRRCRPAAYTPRASAGTSGPATGSPPGNWKPKAVPGAADDATISNGGTGTLDSTRRLTNFTLSSGALSGTGTLDVNGTVAWSGGRMTGTGVTNANGGLSISGAS